MEVSCYSNDSGRNIHSTLTWNCTNIIF